MLNQVLSPDVDDECHPRLERGDVGEVLIGPDAKDDVVIRLLTTATRDGRSAVREAAETALKKIQK